MDERDVNEPAIPTMDMPFYEGLTRFEYTAVAMMQGLLAHHGVDDSRALVREACELARALMIEMRVWRKK
jgi:hypothetical protein